MAQIHIPREIPIRFLPRSRGARLLFGILTLIGLVAFLNTLSWDASRAWRAYVVNWLFFTSVAAGAMALTAATTITKARWNWSVRRMSLAFSAFLPIAFVLLIPMLFLRENYFPWIEMMEYDYIVQKKEFDFALDIDHVAGADAGRRRDAHGVPEAVVAEIDDP